MRVLEVIVCFSVLASSSNGQPGYPSGARHLGASLNVAQRTFLQDPPATLKKDKRSGRVWENRGHFIFERQEPFFDVPVSVSYGFTVNDSVLGYVLASYIESSEVEGSPVGLRDSLWERLGRAQPRPDKETVDGPMRQRVWTDGRRKIVATRVEGRAQTLVVSFTRASPGK
jgi:hypothetical protein